MRFVCERSFASPLLRARVLLTLNREGITREKSHYSGVSFYIVSYCSCHNGAWRSPALFCRVKGKPLNGLWLENYTIAF